MPPLVATGISLVDQTNFDPYITFTIFILNVVGILLGNVIIFTLIRLSKVPLEKGI